MARKNTEWTVQLRGGIKLTVEACGISHHSNETISLHASRDGEGERYENEVACFPRECIVYIGEKAAVRRAERASAADDSPE